jgi:REP element-mobilizing transposase RayT
MLAICECKPEFLLSASSSSVNFTLRASWRCNLASLLWFCLKLFVHMLVEYPPTVQLSKLVNSLSRHKSAATE